MEQRRKQRGFLLIVAVVLIMVAAAMAVVIVTLTAGSGQGAGLHVNSTQAFFAAETGLQRSIYGYSAQAAGCGPLAPPAGMAYNGTLAVGGGSSSYATTATFYNPVPTTLFTAINTTTTIIPVNGVAGFAPRGRIGIGGEAIDYTGTAIGPVTCGVGVPACFTGAARGVGGTTPAAPTAPANSVVIQNLCLVRSTGAANNTQRVLEKMFSSSAMITYVHEDNLGVPYFRRWNGVAWGAEATATTVGSEIRFMVLKAARTRKEYILVTQSANGNINAQIWNGTNWTSDGVTIGATRFLGTSATAANAGERNQRAFDVEYETANDRAVVVYRNGDAADPSYQIWTGAAWIGAAVAAPNGTTGRPKWIELAANPSAASNEIAMIVVDHTELIDGTLWNRAGFPNVWNDMGVAAAWDPVVTAESNYEMIDVVYEQAGARRAMFVWGSSNNCELHYRIWNPGTATLGPVTNFPAIWTGCVGVDARFIKLAADPFTDDIMVGIQDDAGDLGTCLWNGAAWSCPPHPEHNIDVESASSRSFDVVFSSDPTTPGQAWLVWGALAGGGTNIWRRQWTGAAWGVVDIFLGPDLCFPHVIAHPRQRIILGGMYEDADTVGGGNISANYFTGGAWSGPIHTIWDGATLDCQAGVLIHERVAIAAQLVEVVEIMWAEIFP